MSVISTLEVSRNIMAGDCQFSILGWGVVIQTNVSKVQPWYKKKTGCKRQIKTDEVCSQTMFTDNDFRAKCSQARLLYTIMCAQSGAPRPILACEQLSILSMPLSYPIMIPPPINNEPVYLWNVSDRCLWSILPLSKSFIGPSQFCWSMKVLR